MRKIENKSVFFTTVIIIVLLVAALSTSTYAWFSANNVVNVSSISFMAESDEGHGDLAIGWVVSNLDSYRVDFAQPYADENKRLYPMMPVAAPVKGVTTFNEFAIEGYPNFGTSIGDTSYNNQCFVYGIQTSVYDSATESYVTKYQYDGDFTAPYVCKNKADITQSQFYLINKNETYAQEISVSYIISGALSDELCIAVFVNDSFQGVISNIVGFHYGKIEKGTKIEDTNVSVSNCYRSENLKFEIPKANYVTVRLVAWYNGVSMTNSDAEGTATLSQLKFKGAFVEPD